MSNFTYECPNKNACHPFFVKISRKNVPLKRKENHPSLFFVNKELPLDDTFGSPYYYSGSEKYVHDKLKTRALL